MKKILITGGTGGIGTHLTKKLIAKGYEVVLLSRKAGIKNDIRLYEWSPVHGTIDLAAFNGVNHIINLAGAGVADHRWTRAYKKEIYNSRIQSTKLLVNTLIQQRIQVDSLVSTSAIGIYGNEVKGIATENQPPGDTFLARVCNDWETEANKATQVNIRTVIIRVGIVLSKEAGFIPEVAKPIRLYAGAALGSGKQTVSWIHIDDLCNMFMKAIEDPTMSGPYNAVAPFPVSNADLTRSMADKLHRPILLPPVPKFMLQLLFGDIASTLVADQWVSSDHIQKTGFSFTYPTIDAALNNLL
ncbi:MAG: TIGR01777 family oxidoreductase [Bacteroidota bacterium]